MDRQVRATKVASEVAQAWNSIQVIGTSGEIIYPQPDIPSAMPRLMIFFIFHSAAFVVSMAMLTHSHSMLWALWAGMSLVLAGAYAGLLADETDRVTPSHLKTERMEG